MSSLVTFGSMVAGGIVAVSGVIMLSLRSGDTPEELDAPPAAPHWRALLLVVVGCLPFIGAVLFGK